MPRVEAIDSGDRHKLWGIECHDATVARARSGCRCLGARWGGLRREPGDQGLEIRAGTVGALDLVDIRVAKDVVPVELIPCR